MEWIGTDERLPEFPQDTDYVWVIACTEFGVYPMQYTRNRYAKTARGQAPRWERAFGGVADAPVFWMPMPPAPCEP